VGTKAEVLNREEGFKRYAWDEYMIYLVLVWSIIKY